MTIRLHVERLVLEGLPMGGADGARLERAVVAELTRLLRGVDATIALRESGSGAVPALRAAEVPFTAGDPVTSLGARVARSVYRALVPRADAGRGATPAPGVETGR